MAIEVFLKRRPQPFDFCLGLDVCHAQVGHCRPQPLVLGAEFLRGMVSASCVIVVGLIGTAPAELAFVVERRAAWTVSGSKDT